MIEQGSPARILNDSAKFGKLMTWPNFDRYSKPVLFLEFVDDGDDDL